MSFAAESMERLRLAHDRLHEVIRERDELLEALVSANALLAAAKNHVPNVSIERINATTNERLAIRGLRETVEVAIDTNRSIIEKATAAAGSASNV